MEITPTLKAGWSLLLSGEDYILTNLNYKKPTWWFLESVHFYIFSLFDGINTGSGIINKVSQQFNVSIEVAKEHYDKLCKRFHSAIESNSCKSIANYFELNEEYPITDFEKIRSCAPIRLSWVITEQCPMKCIYCYMDATKRKDSLQGEAIDGNAIKKIAIEAKELSINELFVTGGEPFISPNIYNVINHFLDAGIDVRTTTKYLVDTSLIRSKNKSLLHIEQSLDSVDQNVVTDLTGNKKALIMAKSSIQNMNEAGISYSIKSVISKKNLHGLYNLLEFAYKNNARNCDLVEYRESLGRNDESLKLDHNDREYIVETVNSIRSKYNLNIIFDTPKFKKRDTGFGSYCSEGLKTLSILPSGNITRCPSTPKDKNISFCNIFEQGIYGAWNEDHNYINNIKIPKKNYIGTVCYKCTDLDKCGLLGRCIIDSYMKHNSYFNIDRNCPKSKESKVG